MSARSITAARAAGSRCSSGAKLDAVLKATGNRIGTTTGELRQMARNLQDVSIFSDEAIMGVQQLFISTQKVSRDILPQATEAALDMAAALGQDATSAAERLAQALADPAGEVESLKEAFIFLDENQQTQIQNLVEQNKLYEAQKIVLQEIEDTYGGIADTLADTNYGKLETIKNEWQDLLSNMGTWLTETFGFVFYLIDWGLKEVNSFFEDQILKDQIEDVLSIDFTESLNADLSSFTTSALQGAWTQMNQSLNDFLAERRRQGYTDEQTADLLNSQEGRDMLAYRGIADINLMNRISEELAVRLGRQLDAHYGGRQEVRDGTIDRDPFVFDDFGNDLKESLETTSISIDILTKTISTLGLDSLNNPESFSSIKELSTTLENTISSIISTIGTEDLNKEQQLTLLKQLEEANRLRDSLNKVEGLITSIQTNVAQIRDNTIDSRGVIYDPNEAAKAQRQRLDEIITEMKEWRLERNIETAQDIVGGLKGNIQSSLTNIFSSMAQSKGIVGVFGAILNEALGPILDAINPVLEIIDSVINPLTILCTILEAIVDVIAPALQATVQPLIDSFNLLGNLIGSWFLPIFDALSVTISAIGTILNTALLPVLQLLTPLFQLLGLLLEAINPIIQATAVVFEILMSPVKFVADLFTWLGNWISYLGNVIGKTVRNLGYMISFQWGKVNWNFGSTPGGFSSDAFTGLPDRIEDILGLGVSRGDAASDAASIGTSISSAQYQGATSVTINIYQQSPVVGSGGMEEFAQMIRKEFEALDYYGVTV